VQRRKENVTRIEQGCFHGHQPLKRQDARFCTKKIRKTGFTNKKANVKMLATLAKELKIPAAEIGPQDLKMILKKNSAGWLGLFRSENKGTSPPIRSLTRMSNVHGSNTLHDSALCFRLHQSMREIVEAISSAPTHFQPKRVV
jgi:hypothetical protein